MRAPARLPLPAGACLLFLFAWPIREASAGYSCPASSAWIHASCKVTAQTKSSCADVRVEMLARVAGQYARWHDPHNNGTYTLLNNGTDVGFSRKTGDGKYTDKLTFTFEDSGTGCVLSGCSESQVTSVADFSTNYCNLAMLYCGSAVGCSPVEHDFTSTETEVKPSAGASASMSSCLKV
jgi:hypothetical protein